MVNIIINLALLLREFDLFNLNVTGWKRHQSFSIRSFHIFGATEDEGLKNGLNHIESPDEIFRLERNRDKCLPEGKIRPWLHPEEMYQTEKILKPVDYRCSGEDPPMLSADLIASFRGFRLPIFYEMRFVKNNTEKIERKKSPVRATITSPISNLVKFR